MAYTEITNAEVAAGAALTTALMTALRDNLIATINRGTGAPKILGVPYDVQIFPASGTWTKPSNAEAGDVVMLWLVAGGGSGAVDSTATFDAGGGQGGYGAMWRISDIADLAATEAVAIGAGAAARTGTNTAGLAGGATTFGTVSTEAYRKCFGGQRGEVNENAQDDFTLRAEAYQNGSVRPYYGGDGLGASQSGSEARAQEYGGGGGGLSFTPTASQPKGYGALSFYAGNGGIGSSTLNGEAGAFPGGGGAGSFHNAVSGAGADGYMIVYCIKET